jgi:hypothetical protein
MARSAFSHPILIRRRSSRSVLIGAIGISPGMNYRGSVSACSEPRRVIAAKGFDQTDVMLHAAIRGQVGLIVKRLHREGTIENVGAGRASKWKLATAAR